MTDPTKVHAVREDGSKAYITCSGANGRCVVFGWSPTEPVVGEACTLSEKRMILLWRKQGIFGLATHGPTLGDRITAQAVGGSPGVVQQWIGVSEAAVAKLAEHPEWRG